MANFKDYQLNTTLVDAIAYDSTGEYLWIGFALKNGTCEVRKVSARDVSQIYFSVLLSVTSIKDMKVAGSYLFVAVQHATDAMYILGLANPVTNQTINTKVDVSITESPIAITVSSNYVYFLTKGDGDTAQIVKLNTGAGYVETITLIESAAEVQNAISFSVDASENLWIVNNGNPASLYRIYESSGWHVDETILD